MTFAHVGTTQSWDTGAAHSYTPSGVGNLVVFCYITKLASTPMPTGLSASNITWSRLTSDFATSVAATATGASIWIGVVTSTSPANTTITWSGSEPAHWEAEVNEFSSSVGSWALDTSAGIDSNSNNAYPSLTPAGSGELYIGIHYDDSGASAGSTSGYTYHVTSHGNGALYNAACTSSAQAPTWGDSTVMGGIAALIKESSPDSGTADVTLKKMSVDGSGYSISSDESLFHQGAVGTVSYGAPGTTTYGTSFTLSQSASFDGVWYYSAPLDAALPSAVAIYDNATGTVVSGTQDLSPSWSGGLGTGWVKYSFGGSVTLDNRAEGYTVVVLDGSGASKGYSSTDPFPVTSGILTAPSTALGSAGTNAPFDGVHNGVLTFPVSNGDGLHWFVDVQITSITTVSGTADVTLKKMGVSARGHQGGVLQAKMVAGDASSATTITLDVPTAGGTALLLFAVGTAATDNPNVSTITLGGSSDNWVSQLSEGGPTDHAMTEFWSDLNCAAGQTSVVVTPTGGVGVGSVLYWVFECNDLPLSGTIIDKSAVLSSSGFVSSWTVGPTATTAFAKERVFAVGGGNANSSSTVAAYTPPSAPWVTSQQGRSAGGIHTPSGICGYKEVSSTGTQSFAVSASSPTSTIDGLVVALTLNSDISGTGAVTLKKMSVAADDGIYTVWHDSLPDAGTTSTATGQRNDSLVFSVTSDCTLKGIAFYVPSGETNLTGSNYTAALYTTTTGTSGTLVTSQAGSGTFTAGKWNWIPLNVSLTTGVTYSAVINHPDALQYEHSWWGAGEPGANGLTSGPISVPSQAAAPGNVQQGLLNGALGFPGTANSPGSWYGIDVKVSTNSTTTVSGTAGVTLKKMTVAVSGSLKDSGTAAGTLKKMTAAVTGAVLDKGTSAAILRKMTVSGTATAPVAGTGIPVLKKMTTFGSGKAKISGTISVSLRKMTDSGTGLAPIFGTISVTMVKMEVHASDHVPEASPLFLFSLF